jgi:hypothetical protein
MHPVRRLPSQIILSFTATLYHSPPLLLYLGRGGWGVRFPREFSETSCIEQKAAHFERPFVIACLGSGLVGLSVVNLSTRPFVGTGLIPSAISSACAPESPHRTPAIGTGLHPVRRPNCKTPLPSQPLSTSHPLSCSTLGEGQGVRFPRPLNIHLVVMLHRRERIVEMVQQRLPLLIFLRPPESDGM